VVDRRSRTSLAIARGAAVAALMASTGCQLVFGIDAYETGEDPSGTGGGGAPAGGAGAGGEPEGGQGAGVDPGCACDLAEIWEPVVLSDSGPGDSPVPTQCGNGSTPIVVFEGVPSVECTGCTCDAAGCDLPALECFDAASCGGAPVPVTPAAGECSTTPGNGCSSYSLAGEIGEGSCTASVSQPLEPMPAFDQYLAFCKVGGCAAGCAPEQAACVAADGVVAECPAPFAVRYILETGGIPRCEACSCTPSCEGVAYQAGLVSCEEVTIDSTACENPGYRTFFIHAIGAPSCAASPAAIHPGTLELDEPRTVCCKAPLEGVPPS
jgi:hypothetical protein